MKFLALVIFFIASLTDYLDGYIARKKGLVTDLGKFLDPLADKILILGAFISAVELNVVPAWMVIIILMREFAITGLRLLGALKGKALPASRKGKHKMVSQILAIYLILIYVLFSQIYPTSVITIIMQGVIYYIMLVTIFFTLYSGLSYVFAHRDIFV